MTRANVADYAGARGRIGLTDIERLPAGRYAVQPKIDGMYVQCSTDARGRISAILSRTGRPVRHGLVAHLLGRRVAAPWSTLCGELEAHTEAGTRAAESRGWRALHLFDCIRAGGRYLGREPYRARRDALWRMHAALQCQAGPDRPYELDRSGRAHGRGGRFVRPVPRSWRLTPIVEQYPVCRAGELWDRAKAGELEGAVVVALDAPLGKRGAKRKLKPSSTLDCVVRSWSRGAALVSFGSHVWAVACSRAVEPGQIVEITHEGWYERRMEPRFARVTRVRSDLTD